MIFLISIAIFTIIYSCLEKYKWFNEYAYMKYVKKINDINHIGKTGRTDLHDAIYNKYYKVADYLIKEGADINYNYYDDNSIFYRLCKERKLEGIKYLLDKGADRIEIENYFSNEVKEILLTY